MPPTYVVTTITIQYNSFITRCQESVHTADQGDGTTPPFFIDIKRILTHVNLEVHVMARRLLAMLDGVQHAVM